VQWKGGVRSAGGRRSGSRIELERERDDLVEGEGFKNYGRGHAAHLYS
jgi:hypothetical protein